MVKWTEAHIRSLSKKGLKTNIKATKPKKKIKIEKISVEKETIKKVLWLAKREGLISEYLTELQFDSARKFRFDWAIPEHKIAIEYEGIISEKSGHTTISGYTKDCEKYNLAIKNGWRVLRYTALNYENLFKDLNFLLKK